MPRALPASPSPTPPHSPSPACSSRHQALVIQQVPVTRSFRVPHPAPRRSTGSRSSTEQGLDLGSTHTSRPAGTSALRTVRAAGINLSWAAHIPAVGADDLGVTGARSEMAHWTLPSACQSA